MENSKPNIPDIRKEYMMAFLDEAHTGEEPLQFFERWFHEAHLADVNEVNAMTLATVDSSGQPHARIVLLKGLEKGGFTFYTNYSSLKGRNLGENNKAALVFFWPELERQIRIEGLVEKVSESESDLYFGIRPDGSKIGAWASPQSQPIADRSVLEERERQFLEQFSGQSIPRPAHWGGYRLMPQYIEFWQGRASRLHDRICFRLSDNGTWAKARLAP